MTSFRFTNTALFFCLSCSATAYAGPAGPLRQENFESSESRIAPSKSAPPPVLNWKHLSSDFGQRERQLAEQLSREAFLAHQRRQKEFEEERRQAAVKEQALKSDVLGNAIAGGFAKLPFEGIKGVALSIFQKSVTGVSIEQAKTLYRESSDSYNRSSGARSQGHEND